MKRNILNKLISSLIVLCRPRANRPRRGPQTEERLYPYALSPNMTYYVRDNYFEDWGYWEFTGQRLTTANLESELPREGNRPAAGRCVADAGRGSTAASPRLLAGGRAGPGAHHRSGRTGTVLRHGYFFPVAAARRRFACGPSRAVNEQC